MKGQEPHSDEDRSYSSSCPHGMSSQRINLFYLQNISKDVFSGLVCKLIQPFWIC